LVAEVGSLKEALIGGVALDPLALPSVMRVTQDLGGTAETHFEPAGFRGAFSVPIG
jgi:hypothetical protein